MEFYDRTNELAELQRIQNLSFSDHSRLTVVTGRRRIGKTSLIMKFPNRSIRLFRQRYVLSARCFNI